jgi:hypothetical protein
VAEKDLSAGRSAVPAKLTDIALAAASEVTVADAMAALTKIVEAVRTHELESTKREKLRTYAETEVERINASERVLKVYFDRVFEERRETNRDLFARLDAALESGDAANVQAVVGGIVEIARHSPLANLGNLGQLRAALDDPNTVFEF